MVKHKAYTWVGYCLLVGDTATVFHLIFWLCLISYCTTGTCYFNSFDPLVNRRVELLGNGDNFLRISQIHSWTCSRELNKVEFLEKLIMAMKRPQDVSFGTI